MKTGISPQNENGKRPGSEIYLLARGNIRKRKAGRRNILPSSSCGLKKGRELCLWPIIATKGKKRLYGFYYVQSCIIVCILSCWPYVTNQLVRPIAASRRSPRINWVIFESPHPQM